MVWYVLFLPGIRIFPWLIGLLRQKRHCGMWFRLTKDSNMLTASGLSSLALPRPSSPSGSGRLIEGSSNDTDIDQVIPAVEPADFQRVNLIEKYPGPTEVIASVDSGAPGVLLYPVDLVAQLSFIAKIYVKVKMLEHLQPKQTW